MRRPIDPRTRRMLSFLDRLETGARTVQTALVVVGIVGVLAIGGLILANLDAGSRAAGGTFYIAVAILVAVGSLVGVLLRRSRRSFWDVAGSGARDTALADPAANESNGRLRRTLTPEEVSHARGRRDEGFDWDDVCRLVVPSYAWWSPAEKAAFRQYVETEVGRDAGHGSG